MSRPATTTLPCACEWRWVLLAVGALGVSCVMTQLALMREFLCVFSGNELVVGVVLGNWLLLSGLGAGLGRTSSRLRHPAAALVLAQMLVALIPLAQVVLLRGLRHVFFVRGAAVGLTETFLGSLVLLLPYCLVSGYFLPLACTLLAGKDRSRAVGGVYVADSLGSILGGGLFGLVLIRFFDHFGLLCFPAILNLAVAAVMAWSLGARTGSPAPASRTLFALACLLGAGLLGMALWVDMDARSTAWQYPQQRIVFRANSPYGKLIVTESASQYNFVHNGLAVASSHNLEQAEETVHYAMAQRPDAQQVLLVGGAVSGAAREILKYGVRVVTCVELDPLLLEVARQYLPGALVDARIHVVNTDGRRFIQRTHRRFDVVIVDVPDPSTSQLNRFYTAEFYAEVKRILEPDGVLAFALGRYHNFVSPELARLLASARATLATAFRHTLLIPGGQVFFLASDGRLHEEIAARLEQRQIPTRFVKKEYLEAMLTPDRLADMRRATSAPAAVNEDFNPVLYFYHLVHWLSQFGLRLGWRELALAAVIAVYVARLRPVSLAIFASGFAASALEVVLLLAFQALYGSLYRQVAVIVTLFMAGLALGAFLANRQWRGVFQPAAAGCPRAANPAGGLRQRLTGQGGRLSCLALALAAFAALLPLLMRGIGGLDSTGRLPVLALAGIPLLTFGLGCLVGMEFPVASRLEAEEPTAVAARLYTADFVGACLGAWLASSLMVPVLGVTRTCLLTAVLNVAGGFAVLFRRH